MDSITDNSFETEAVRELQIDSVDGILASNIDNNMEDSIGFVDTEKKDNPSRVKRTGS